MKRLAPLTYKQRNLQYQEAQPLLQHNRRNQKQRAFDAATEYFKKHKSPLTDTLQSLFGTKFFARAALWLDPLAPFRNTAGIICYENRHREKPSFTDGGTVTDRFLSREYRTYWPDDPKPYAEFLYSTGTEETPTVIEINGNVWYSRMDDSTRKSRDWANSWGSDDKYDRRIPSYGTMTMDKFSSVTTGSPNVVYKKYEEYNYLSGGEPYGPLYSRVVDTNRLSIDGTCVTSSGSLFILDLDDFAIEFMNDNVSGMIQDAIATRRSFDLTYQIAELKDIPRLLKSIGDLRDLVSKYIKDPSKFLSIDKEIGNLYLSWEFGVAPMHKALKDLMMLPERATKRLNYLIKRNGKVSTGRSKRVWSNAAPKQGLPTFEFSLPSWIEVQDQEVTRTFNIELRCIVNQTIQFPQLAVPSISDKDYQKLIGLRPTAEDIYNIIPFTWLIDWFGGLGSYIGIMSAIHDDRLLINYGFLTIVITEELHHKAGLKVSNAVGHYHNGVQLSYKEDEWVFPYHRTYTRKYQRRVSIGDLEGVKSFGFLKTNLTDFQTSILGALFSQRAK
jgi:hypothetical protein